MQRTQRKNTRNIVHFLQDRESCLTRRFHYHKHSQLSAFSYNQDFYRSITPNLTIQSVETAVVYIRKFTPDGKYLITFSNDQRSIVIWEYRGVGSVAGLLKDEQRECVRRTDQDAKSKEIRENIFHLLFQKRFTVGLAYEHFSRYHLHREFGIFLDDGRYMLLAGMGFSERRMPVNYYMIYPDIYDNLELFAYVFYVVDVQKGRLTDCMTFNHDNIMLSHNHGVSVHGKTIAIMSRFRQTVLIFEHDNGKIRPASIWGPFNDPTPMSIKGLTLEMVSPLSRLKQRIFTYMYRDIMKSEALKVRRRRLRLFHKEYPTLEKMVIEKMQLLDSDTLLLRYEELPVHAPNAPSMHFERNVFNYYVFFSMSEDRVLKVCHKDSVQLLYMVRNFCDNFRNVRSLHTNQATPSPSNNIYLRKSFDNAINSIQSGVRDAARTFNPTVPVCTQSYGVSQYLNCNLFMYDDRFISVMERPKVSPKDPLRFYDRRTGLTNFRLHLQPPVEMSTSRDLAAYVFHPYEPFLLTIQRLSSGFCINFHIYNASTIVQR